MSSDARMALEALTTALNEHLVAAQNKRGEDDPAVEAAFFAVADAFEAYEEALYDAHDEVTPLTVFADDDDDDLDYDEDEDDEDDLLEDNEMMDEDLIDEEDFDDEDDTAEDRPGTR